MPRRAQKNVGVIGLGIIGSRVADNLRRKGFHVFVWNRSPRPVPNFVGAPEEVIEMCDCVQIFVSDDDALLAVVNQLAPALAPRHIVLAHSTVSPHSMRAAADIVERRGARFVEAPFTGSKLGAEKGELVYYVAGDEVALREARPILEASSKDIIEIGQIGQATVIKIATNILTAATIQAAAEALALTQHSGVPLEKFAAAMESNASKSGTLAMKLPKMMSGDFEPHFSIKHMLKDIQIASRVGLLDHLELSVTTATRDRLLEQMQRGFGDEDYSAVVRKYFHEIRPASQEEAELELFDKPAAIEPFPSPQVMPEPEPSTNANAEPVLNLEESATLPEEKPSTPAENEMLVGGTAEGESKIDDGLQEPSAMSEPEAENAGLAAEPAGVATEQAEEVEAVRSRRGLFDRLLRRGSEY
jgi:3-hydroxyisobutyrate dehydrogenase-like beta-hydroxyacid dehydrogenase